MIFNESRKKNDSFDRCFSSSNKFNKDNISSDIFRSELLNCFVNVILGQNLFHCEKGFNYNFIYRLLINFSKSNRDFLVTFQN